MQDSKLKKADILSLGYALSMEHAIAFSNLGVECTPSGLQVRYVPNPIIELTSKPVPTLMELEQARKRKFYHHFYKVKY